MSELFLVRHAQASFGADDYDRLSELGHRQARWLGEHFSYRELQFDRVVCGDMVRHRETADNILRGMGLEPIEPETDPAWNEFDFESIVAAYLAQFPAESPPLDASRRAFSRILRNSLEAWAGDRLEAPLPERWQDFELRVRRGLETIAGERDERCRILLVSSGGAISMALRQILEAPAGTMVHLNLQLRNSGVSHLFFNGRNMHLSAFNHVPHLDHPDRVDSITYY